jgi:hypothetical protein
MSKKTIGCQAAAKLVKAIKYAYSGTAEPVSLTDLPSQQSRLTSNRWASWQRRGLNTA